MSGSKTATTKKKKRTGEEFLFNEIGKLNDEALNICKISGVDPRALQARSVDSFLKKGVTQREAEK